MVLWASFQLNTSISGSQLSGLPQGKGTTFPRQKQEKTAFCVVNRALKSYYIGTQGGGEVRGTKPYGQFFFFWGLKNNCQRVRSRTGVFFLELKNNCPRRLASRTGNFWLSRNKKIVRGDSPLFFLRGTFFFSLFFSIFSQRIFP